MKFKQTQIESLFNQEHGFLSKVLLVAHKSKDHADCKSVFKRKPCGEIHRYNDFYSKDEVIDALKRNSYTSETCVRSYNIGIAVEPLALALALTIEQFYALHGPQ